jgi:TP901 family phage tail tape measure protein
MADKNFIINILTKSRDAALTKLNAGLIKAANNAKKLAANMLKATARTGLNGMKAGVIATGAAMVAGVADATRYNVQMARVWTMADGGIETFNGLRKEARALASDFGLARASIADGMYNALSAGVDQNVLPDFMRTAAKVAVADGSDISVAVDGITTVLNAFKIAASETGSVTDQLFQTVAQGKTTFGELSSYLATVAPVAAATNIPLNEILAHVAALTAQGTPTSQAMTQIRASIIGLNKTLGDGWTDTMTYQEALQAVWDEAGHGQTELFKLVGSTEAVQAVLGGVGGNAEMARSKLKGMKDAAGAAQDAFEKVDEFNEWPKLLESAKGWLEKAGEVVEDKLKPSVKKVTDWINKWTDSEDVWSNFGSFLDGRIKELKGLYTTLKDGIDASELLVDIGDLLEAALTDAAVAAWEAVKPLIEPIGAVIGSAIREVLYDVPIIGDQMKAADDKKLEQQAFDEYHKRLYESGGTSPEEMAEYERLSRDPEAEKKRIMEELRNPRMPRLEGSNFSEKWDSFKAKRVILDAETVTPAAGTGFGVAADGTRIDLPGATNAGTGFGMVNGQQFNLPSSTAGTGYAEMNGQRLSLEESNQTFQSKADASKAAGAEKGTDIPNPDAALNQIKDSAEQTANAMKEAGSSMMSQTLMAGQLISLAEGTTSEIEKLTSRIAALTNRLDNLKNADKAKRV